MRSNAPSVVAVLLSVALLPAQGPPANGPREVEPGWHALVGADVVVRPGERIANATVVIRDGRFVSIAAGGKAPPGARVWMLQGLTLYPGLIECCLPVDVPAPDGKAPDLHWNPYVLPQRSALQGEGATGEQRRALRSLGFCAAAIAPSGGVCKGSSAVVLLDEPVAGRSTGVVREAAYQLLSFQTAGSGYPDSEMGAIALLRQTLLDADWYERSLAAVAQDRSLAPPAPNVALAALARGRQLPLGIDVDDELEVMRAAAIAAEAGRPAFVFGSGFEFRRLAAVAACKLPLVVPLHYPEAPDVATLHKQRQVTLRQLWSWEQAPTNSKRLLDAGVELAWTTLRLPDKQDFRRNAARAIACGIAADAALAAVTTVPARLCGVADTLGSIEPGKLANCVAVAGDLFDPAAKIRRVWVGGRPYDVDAADEHGLDGRWALQLLGRDGELTIAGDRVELRLGDDELQGSRVERDGGRIDFWLQGERLADGKALSLHALAEGERLHGSGRGDGSDPFAWTAARRGDAAPAAAKDEPPATPVPEVAALPTPVGAYGLREPPRPQTAVFTGATLWTAGPLGIVKNGALFVQDGRIVFAGPAADLPQLPVAAVVVDVAGKHITPGLVDCHSHTGISRGVNEGTQAVTAEVRVQDVINPDDVNWYRQLAGGVTAVNQLHGSANPIGGQSSVVKLRWGCESAADMALPGAPGGIKFALGENPRRANGSGGNDRYPNTRMGVAALIRDRFVAAREYAAEQAAWAALSPRERARRLPPRRDLELDALAEVVLGQRRIHCHSYRQDEIFMLCRLAKEFGFRIGTFQHVLEGYKVAEAIAESAIGASAFSDWWAYKLEVYDAIPDNGAIMRDRGVVVTFNSDSNELARRLNTEAGKAVKYGGVPPAAAIGFVTINAAVQLGVDARIGSLEKGKDADFAIWSDDPLSYQSRCEATYVDGRPLFTIERDRELRAEAERQRQRLLQLALAAAGRGGGGRGGGPDAYEAAEDHSAPYCCGEAGGR